MYKYFKKIGNTENISEQKSRGLSDKVIKPTDNKLSPTLEHAGKRMYVTFNGSCLKQDKSHLIMEKQSTYTLLMIQSQLLTITQTLLQKIV